MARLGSYVRRHHVALLALFVALGGTSYAALKLPAGSVGSTQLRKGAVTLDKVAVAARRKLRGKLGPRGDRGQRGEAGTPGAIGPTGPAVGPAGGDLSGSFPNPSLATGAVTSAKLAGGAVTSDKLAAGAVGGDRLAAAEAWHEVGTTGEPSFLGSSLGQSWRNVSSVSGNDATAGFYKDPYGVVRFQGAVCSTSTTGCQTGPVVAFDQMFTLPSGFRPSHRLDFTVATNTGSCSSLGAGIIEIAASGAVYAMSGNYCALKLEGIAFRVDS